MTMQELIRQQRRELKNSESLLFRQIILRYRGLWDWLRVRLAELDSQMTGTSIPVSIQLEQIRLRQFRNELRSQLAAVSGELLPIITENRFELAALGITHADALVQNGVAAARIEANLNRVPIEAIQSLILAFDERAPIRSLLDNINEAGADRVLKVLEEALVRGSSPRKSATAVRNALKTTRSRALLIARTETLRAYRASSMMNFEANRDLLRGWRWVASLSSRTCPSCIALHGTVHPLDEEFGEHPAGRCSPAPVVIGDDREWETGSDWFSKLPVADQRQILGQKGFDQYQSGIPLSSWIHESVDDRWGLTRRSKTPN